MKMEVDSMENEKVFLILVSSFGERDSSLNILYIISSYIISSDYIQCRSKTPLRGSLIKPIIFENPLKLFLLL